MNANDPARDERADRNLLFGVLALQMDFIRRENLIAATSAWVLDKARGLDQILLERQALSADEHALLVALVAKHLAKHNNDPQQSLAAVSSVGSIRDELRKLGDPQLEASLAVVAQQPPAADPYATNLPSTCDWGGTGLRFRILRPHARGGLGEVFVAQDLELHREVALKEIQSRFADQPDSRSRFVLEAEITGGLEHPGIVPVYGLGQYADGRPFYAMRFIRGDSLKDAIEHFHKADVAGRDPGERTLELRKLLGRFIDVCEAIEYAHSRGILHRDLKPGNIMLGKYGETLVVDWGLAKAVGRGERTSETGETTLQPASSDSVDPTIMGKAIGTPAFMSPEQAAGRLNELGPASDVYSLGATLYCLLTGQPPFSGNDKGEILRRVQQGEIPLPREIKPQLSSSLQAICLKAMSLKPTDRYASPRILAGDIEHWLADEPVSCLAEPFAVRARRWMKRHRSLVASFAAGFAVLVASLIGLLALVVVHNRTLDAKNRQLDQANTQLAQANSDLNKSNALERAAKADADQKRIYAEQTRDEVNQVFMNLVTAFRKPNPSADGEKITVAEMFDAAAVQLDSTFPNQPLIQAQVLNAIGLLYQNLGLYEKAIAVHERARNLRRDDLGEDHEHTLTSMSGLVQAYHSAGRRAEALALLEQTLKLTKAKIGPDRQETLSLMGGLALMYASEGRLAEASPLYEQTLELMKAKLGPDHSDTLTTMGGLISVHWSAGRRDEALRLHEGMLKLMEGKFGPDHSNTLSAMDGLARLYWSAARLQDALPLYEKVMKLKKSRLGPFHHDTLGSMRILSTAYRSAGRMQESLALLEETLNLSKEHLGKDGPETLLSMALLASSYQEAGRQAEALALFEGALNLSKAKFGPDDPSTLAAMKRLAYAYAFAGKLDHALPLYEHTLAARKAKLGADHSDTLDSMDDLARSYLSAGRLPEALTLYEDLLKLRKAKLGLDHLYTLDTMNNLAEVYLEAKEPDKAIPLLTDWLARLRKQFGSDDPNLIVRMRVVGWNLLKHEEFFEAEKILRECLTSNERMHPDSWVTFNTKSAFGGALLGQKKYAEAEPLLTKGYQGMKEREAKIPSAAKARLSDAVRRLVDLYTAWDKPEEAAKWKAVLEETAKPSSK